jgi:2-methylcitrate dehydratase PrpD
MAESMSRTFSRYIVSLDYEALPPEVVDKVKASLLHHLIISIVGAGTQLGQAAIALVKEEEAKADGATILVEGSRATRFGAASANSKLMHATNQADSYRMLLHPGPCIIPAGLATAELGGCSGKELLTALAAGYEVEARIGGDFIPTTQARGFRSSAVYGTLGPAIATGKLLGLTEDQLVTALALACTFTGGTTEGPRSGGREMVFHEPNATRNGIMAALLARENVRGSELALEGEAGFYNAFTGNNRGELTHAFQEGPLHTGMAGVVAGLGSRWELMHVTPKMYPTAGYNNPVIELMTRIRAQHPDPVEEIESITLDMNWLETTYPSPAFPNPDRRAPGIGSTHFYTAHTCVHGSYPPLSARIDPGRGPTGEDRAVASLMERIEVVGHKDRPAFAPCITIHLRDGTQYDDQFNGDELKWDLATETRRIGALFPELPWPEDQLQSIVQAVSGLEDQSRVDPLIQLCVRR